MIDKAEMIVTSIISRIEVIAAFSRAYRMQILTENNAQKAIMAFRSEWEFIPHLPVTEATVIRTDNLAWDIGLRGYDAIHLASALLWQEMIDLPVTLLTYDKQLWEAAKIVGLETLPNTI